MERKLYKVSRLETHNASNVNFQLHCHDAYEILLFRRGDSRYIVEGRIYSLEPGDMMIMRKNEMHRIYHNSETTYERYLMVVEPDFFRAYHCPELEAVFLEKTGSQGNKIDSALCRSCGLHEAFERLQKYSGHFQDRYTPIVAATVIEILYLINNIEHFSKDDTPSPQLKSIIAYINDHFTAPLTLDALSQRFYISKSHLCRIFKEGTGITVHNYITGKRLTRARELKAQGHSLAQAAALAGFADYSSFYRASQKIQSQDTDI